MQNSEPSVEVPLGARRIAVTEKAVLYSAAMSYGEYVASSPEREFLEIRRREIRLLPDEQAAFTQYPDVMYWLVLADDGPDSLVVLPLFAHIVAWMPRAPLRVVYAEDAEPLLQALVDDDELVVQWIDADLPLLLAFDEMWQFLDAWGPHPQAIEGDLEAWLAAHEEYDGLAEDESAAGQAAFGRLQTGLMQQMRVWYNSTLNQATGEELATLLARWHGENGNGGDDADEDENGDE